MINLNSQFDEACYTVIPDQRFNITKGKRPQRPEFNTPVSSPPVRFAASRCRTVYQITFPFRLMCPQKTDTIR